MNRVALSPIVRGFALAAALSILAPATALVRAQSGLTVIASGLDNPRGLSFGPDGALYVAEAGRGGTSTACAPAPDPPFANRCYGPSGAITRILAVGDQRRVVVGLPSIAGASGGNAQGPVDIDFGLGAAWVTIGFGGNPALRAPLEAAGALMGRLVRINSIGQPETLLDLSAYEAAANPDGGAVDSNPFGLRIVSDGAYYADAGANAVMKIALTGAISTFAVFPNRQPTGAPPTVQAVPTSVEVAPSGDVFVGELTGAPFIVGAARVYRIPASGGTPQVVATGFTNIIGIALAADGTGYVLEHDADGILGPGVDGRLIRINVNGTQTVLASAGLVKPGGVAVGPDGAVYVTTHANTPGNGEVVRIQP
jgi:DNA-binding beta-propeller fold protein YncE